MLVKVLGLPHHGGSIWDATINVASIKASAKLASALSGRIV